MTAQQILVALVDVLLHFTAVSIVLSILIHYRYMPFDDPVPLTQLTMTTDMISPGHLLNSYCHAGKY